MKASAAPEQAVGDQTRLKENVIGPLGLAALTIGITSPAMGLYVGWGSMQAMAGPIPLIFLAAMVLTLPTAISYAVLNRARCTSCRTGAVRTLLPGEFRCSKTLIFGGERGIRTLEGLLTLTPLAGVRLRPLGHLSAHAGAAD